MKIKTPFIIGVLIVGMASAIVWSPWTRSQSNLPYPDKPLQSEVGLSACKKATANEVFLMRTAWDKNLNAMLDQEKPASEMVDEAFEGMRTYRCWLDYLCQAVLYSSNANPKNTRNTPDDPESGYRPLTTGEIDTISGCASPNNIQIPDTSIHYIPECAVDTKTAQWETSAQKNFADCNEIKAREFSDPSTDYSLGKEPANAAQKMMNESPAFIAMERALKARSGEQAAAPLRDKLISINTKLNTMVAHMNTAKSLFESLYNRIPCFCPKCD